MDKPKIEIDEFHKPGPTCRHCKTPYVVHVLAAEFRVWTCYAQGPAGGYCGTINVWKRER